MPDIITIDDSDGDDADFKRAIALSLQTPLNQPLEDAAIDAPDPLRHDDDDQEDEDIKRAIALSLQTAPNHPMSSSNQQLSPNRSETISHSAQPTTNSILGLDRRKMEEERLARLTKKRQATVDVDTPPVEQVIEPSSKKMKTSHQPENSLLPPALPQTPSLQYPQGAIRKTWSSAHPRSDDAKIEQVLNADKVKLAVICSFMWDLEWLFTKFNARTAKFLFVMAAKTEAEREQRTREAEIVGKGRIGVCFPPLEGQAKIVHSKFMLLVYEDSLRLVVTSANLTPYDWGETGVLENVVFVIDLPRLEAPRAEEELTFFGRDLLYFLTKANLPEGSLKSLLRFDFSATKNMAFVHSV